MTRKRTERARSSQKGRAASTELVLRRADESLLDVVDNLLTKGVVVTGDLMLGVAEIDLIYLRLSLVLCAADRAFPDRERDRTRSVRRRLGPSRSLKAR